ncbi:uncharacterized protein LOC141527343 [Cotesia typhae]|uniref:uncharacterized protein LOC141527343 n=1 Tax=Cotesia typhae TaxID=2053667 RepID=UPI003D68BD9E
MDDAENDGRDYSENIDEGPTSNVETEGFFTSDKKDPNKDEEPDKDSKIKTEIVKPATMSKGPCVCKRKMKGVKHRKRKFKRNSCKRRSLNPFIIFYLQMYYKNPSKCITEVACQAGKIWSSMTRQQKEEYIKKAKSRNGKAFKTEDGGKKGKGRKGKKMKSEDKKIKKEVKKKRKDC